MVPVTFKVKLGTKWGMIDKDGNIVVKQQYDEVGNLQYGFTKVRLGAKWGFVDQRGQLVISPTYSYAYDFFHGHAIVKINNKWGVVNSLGQMTMPAKFDNLVLFSQGMGKTKMKNKWAVVDPHGKMITSAIYDDVREFPEGLISVWKGGRFAFLTAQNGLYKLSPFYNEMMGASHPAFVYARAGNNWGMTDRNGKVILPYRYQQLDPVQNGFIRAKANGKWGIITSAGESVVPVVPVVRIQYEEIHQYPNQKYEVKQAGKWGVVGPAGKVLVNIQYDQVQMRTDGVAEIVLNDKRGFVDTLGSGRMEPQFDSLSAFEGNLAVATLNGKAGLVSRSGDLLVTPQYDQISLNSEGLPMFQLHGKWGFLDVSGKEVVPPIYDGAVRFIEGVGLVEKDKKWGYVNHQGNFITPVQFDQAEPFKRGLASVKIGKKIGYIDKQGAFVFNHEENALEKYQFTYDNFSFDGEVETILEWLPQITELADRDAQEQAARNMRIAESYKNAHGPFDRGVQIDSYNSLPSTFLLDVFLMLGDLQVDEAKGTEGKGTEGFVQALVDAGYVDNDEIRKGMVNNRFVAHVLYNIFKDTIPYQNTVKLADTDDPALLWAVEKRIPGFRPDADHKIYPEIGGYASNYRPAILYCTYLFPFPNEQKPRYFSFDYKNVVQFGEKENILHNKLQFNGIPYYLAVDTRPELEQDPIFLREREKAKQMLLQQTFSPFQKWLHEQRLKLIHQ